MSGKVQPAPAYPPATCMRCSGWAHVVRWNTFSYWYCSKCRAEVEVWLRIVPVPPGVKDCYAWGGATYSVGDISIAEPGIYRLHYSDGTYGWFRRTEPAGSIPTIFDGNKVRSATRLTDGDLPSGIRMQTKYPAAPRTQQAAGGHGPRPLASEGDSSKGISEAPITSENVFDFLDELDRQFSPSACTHPGGEYAEVSDHAAGPFGVQHGTLPPDDEL